MIGEREDTYQDSNYGTLTMRSYSIDGNDVNAFYDAQDNLVFVLDNTINAQKPNVLLVINPDGDKKWDEILSSEYGVDLENIRPKVDNKYQKLDIEYSGLGVYESLINAYNAGDDLAEHLNQLSILRDSAARHSAMIRLNAANETISKTNATIVKTKESIVRLEARIKTLRSKLSAAKKEIGRVNTKQSASKILKLESQIEATNEKLTRAKKRLESAQKRLDAATVDAELASALLNQPAVEVKQTVKSKPVVVAPEYPMQTISAEEDINENKEEEIEMVKDNIVEDENDVKPLIEEDPQILNEDIAFKPISFDAPVYEEPETKSEPEAIDFDSDIFKTDTDEEVKPVLESFKPIEEPSFIPEPITEEKAEIMEDKPIIESFEPINDVPEFTPEPVAEEKTEIIEEEKPVLETMQSVQPAQPVMPVPDSVPVPPVHPVYQNSQAQTNFQIPAEVKNERSKPGFVYYVLLLLLILLSVFTLWLYQKSVADKDSAPVLTVTAQEPSFIEPEPEQVIEPEPVAIEEDGNADVFLDEQPVEQEPSEPVEDEPAEPTEEPMVEDVEPEESEIEEEPEEPFVMDAVPGRLNTSGETFEEEQYVMSEEEILASKPVYETGAKHDDMFINEEDYVEPEPDENYYHNDGFFVDEEEMAYQAEQENMYY